MDYIKDEVNKLVKKYKTRDPFELCDALKISVLYPSLHPSINGIYQLVKRNKIIHLNISLNESGKIITCGHELGHALLHPTFNCFFMKNHTFFDTNKVERAANIFNAHLLIEDELLNFNGTIYELSIELNLPVELLQLKLQASR